MNGHHWAVKYADIRDLERELNAFHQQGYSIRWLFRHTDVPGIHGQEIGFDIVAELTDPHPTNRRTP